MPKDNYTWEATDVQVWEKLRKLKQAYKVWNINCFGNVQLNIQKASRDLEIAQQQLNLDPMNSTLIIKENQCRETYFKALQKEESYAKQKSRQHWLALGTPTQNSFMLHWNEEKQQTTSKNVDSKMEIILKIWIQLIDMMCNSFTIFWTNHIPLVIGIFLLNTSWTHLKQSFSAQLSLMKK